MRWLLAALLVSLVGCVTNDPWPEAEAAKQRAEQRLDACRLEPASADAYPLLAPVFSPTRQAAYLDLGQCFSVAKHAFVVEGGQVQRAATAFDQVLPRQAMSCHHIDWPGQPDGESLYGLGASLVARGALKEEKSQLLPALDCYLMCAELGHLMAINADWKLWLEANRTSRAGLAAAERLLADNRLPPTSYRRILKRLEPLVEAEALVRLAELELVRQQQHVKWLEAGKHPELPELDAALKMRVEHEIRSFGQAVMEWYPYLRKPALPEQARRLDNQVRYGGRICGITGFAIPIFSQAVVSQQEQVELLAAVRLRAALELARVKSGRYPDQLSQLVKAGYVEAVPEGFRLTNRGSSYQLSWPASSAARSDRPSPTAP
ncbi:MAG: hypothetical protein KC910_23055 [Candidatus Eremiobacteraeota bacterium]|nr:hypothetical protein [Candidatus Eremiobacteraeota bacterium]